MRACNQCLCGAVSILSLSLPSLPPSCAGGLLRATSHVLYPRGSTTTPARPLCLRAHPSPAPSPPLRLRLPLPLPEHLCLWRLSLPLCASILPRRLCCCLMASLDDPSPAPVAHAGRPPRTGRSAGRGRLNWTRGGARGREEASSELLSFSVGLPARDARALPGLACPSSAVPVVCLCVCFPSSLIHSLT